MSAETRLSVTHGVDGDLGRFYQDWNAAFDARDSAAFVALYAPDARLMAPGAAALVGRDAIKSYIDENFFALGEVSTQMQSVMLIEDRDYITDVGTYVITFDSGIQTAGNYMTMFRRSAAGELQAHYDIFSPSAPAM